MIVTLIGSKSPLGLSGRNASLDVAHVSLDALEGVDLPVGARHGGLNKVLLCGVEVIDGLVLRVRVANMSVLDGLWLELGDGALDGGPVVVLERLDRKSVV